MVAWRASAAFGQGLFGQGAYGLGFYNYGGSAVNQPTIPYYAMFPPVYYSYPVARTYGYSPFAYPPGTRTPEAAPKVGAVEYRNPFVPQGDKTDSGSNDRVASAAKTYYNPYVSQFRTASKPARRDAVMSRSGQNLTSRSLARTKPIWTLLIADRYSSAPAA